MPMVSTSVPCTDKLCTVSRTATSLAETDPTYCALIQGHNKFSSNLQGFDVQVTVHRHKFL